MQDKKALEHTCLVSSWNKDWKKQLAKALKFGTIEHSYISLSMNEAMVRRSLVTKAKLLLISVFEDPFFPLVPLDVQIDVMTFLLERTNKLFFTVGCERVKEKARVKVQEAVYSGALIKPQACVKCGTHGRIEAHHVDYNQPLKIEWLCVTCHKQAHREESPYLPLNGPFFV